MTNNTEDDDAIEVYSDYKAKKMIRFSGEKREKTEKPSVRSEKLVEAMKSNWLELHKTYRGYEPVPAPADAARKTSLIQKKAVELEEHLYEVYESRGESGKKGEGSRESGFSGGSLSPKYDDFSVVEFRPVTNARRAPSLDSLVDSSAADSSSEDRGGTHSDSDSGADLGRPGRESILPSENLSSRWIPFVRDTEPDEHIHDKKEIKDETPKNNTEGDFSGMRPYVPVEEIVVKEKKNVVRDVKRSEADGSAGVVSARKFSAFSCRSGGLMETIVEESSEPKVSVKEILARFETMSEKPDVLVAAVSLFPLQQKTSPSRGPPAPERRENAQLTSSAIHHLSETSNGGTAAAAHISNGVRQSNNQPSMNGHQMHAAGRGEDNDLTPSPDASRGDIQLPLPSRDGRHSLLQFAVHHFRQSPELDALKTDTLKGGKNTNGGGKARREDANGDWTWKRQTDLVKWQPSPLRGALLRLHPPELSGLAVECFSCVLRYCGDAPPAQPPQDLEEVKCVYTVLMHCHKHLALRDEVYCQLMKQTTSNKSVNPESCQRAWRLMSIVAAYFGCSDTLRPYLLEYLSSAAGDRRRHCQGTAAVCLANLRKTARCGGRKNVPSVEEVTAVSAGRSARRQIYRLPGGAERVVNTRCSTVVQDVIHDLCDLIGVTNEAEQAEFSLYCIVQGDAFTMPLAADEYILDVTTELQKAAQPFYLIFCRSVWYHPLRHDANPLYTEVLFNQVAPDYLEGLLLELPGGGRPSAGALRDVALVAALLHRAADLNHPPHLKEIKFLLPKPVLGLREVRPAKWASLVQADWAVAQPLTTHQAKAQVLAVLSQWPLFGSSFFAVKRVTGGGGATNTSEWRDHILALNRRGVHFLDVQTHETLQHWPFAEVISTRKVRSEDGSLFLDMKCGSLLQQRVTRLQTEQAHEVSRLVRQYITLQQSGAGPLNSD